jgi:hypothetical protein
VTRKNLDRMIALHTLLLERARDMLDQHYEQMPDQEQGRWLNEFRKQTMILRGLAEEKPDRANGSDE